MFHTFGFHVCCTIFRIAAFFTARCFAKQAYRFHCTVIHVSDCGAHRWVTNLSLRRSAGCREDRGRRMCVMRACVTCGRRAHKEPHATDQSRLSVRPICGTAELRAATPFHHMCALACFHFALISPACVCVSFDLILRDLPTNRAQLFMLRCFR